MVHTADSERFLSYKGGRKFMLSILFAAVFLGLMFKCVGLVLKICGKMLGAVISIAGFLISIAIGAIVFGLSTAFSVLLLGVAVVWLLVKIIL